MDNTSNRVFGDVIEQLKRQSRIGRYYDDPALFALDVLGITLWSKQVDIVNAMMQSDHVSVRSCHGSGKSFTASIIAVWWVATRLPRGDTIVVTTAPTHKQVHAILWEDIRKHWQKAKERYEEGLSPIKLPGYITQGDDWKTDGGTLIGMGRKPADGDDHGFNGIHRDFVLVIVDEACGIKEKLWDAVEAITTTEDSKIVAIGNPDDPATTFYKHHHRNSGVWLTLDVSAFDSPNFTREHAGHYRECPLDDPECLTRMYAARWDRDRDIPKKMFKLLPNKNWVEARRKEWGIDAPVWQSKVLGQFPTQSVNRLFSIDTINRAIDTEIAPKVLDDVILGVDLSRFGEDYSTVYKYEGGNLRLVDSWGGKADEVDGMESAARVDRLAKTYGAKEVRIDGEGVGGPILDQIHVLSRGTYKIIEMRGNRESPDPYRWKNARAYWFDKLREKMFTRKVDIDPDDEKLQGELEIILYHFKNSRKSLQIESKDDMKSRGVKSPDYADAAVYAAADMSYVTEDPLATLKPGQKITFSIDEFSISPY